VPRSPLVPLLVFRDLPHPAADGRHHIETTHLQSLFNRYFYRRVSILAAQQQNIDHRAGSRLPALPLFQHLPKAIEAYRPTSLRSPLLERCRTGKRSWLLRQCFQVVLQIQNLLLSIEATFVPGYALSLMPYLYVRGIHLDLHFHADRKWNRVEIGQHSYAAAGVHMGKVNRCQVEAFCGQSAQVFAFGMHPCANHLGTLADHPLLILLRGFPQQDIQLFPTRYLRHRHQMVAAK
jgi:hypothetical protein